MENQKSKALSLAFETPVFKCFRKDGSLLDFSKNEETMSKIIGIKSVTNKDILHKKRKWIMKNNERLKIINHFKKFSSLELQAKYKMYLEKINSSLFRFIRDDSKEHILKWTYGRIDSLTAGYFKDIISNIFHQHKYFNNETQYSRFMCKNATLDFYTIVNLVARARKKNGYKKLVAQDHKYEINTMNDFIIMLVEDSFKDVTYSDRMMMYEDYQNVIELLRKNNALC